MTEHDLVASCRDRLTANLPGAFWWKVNDNRTGGIPDAFIAFSQAVSMIEFKFMKKGENIHQKWEDERQLVTCVKLENALGRCWVVAYRDAWKLGGREWESTIIYRPSRLLHDAIPETQEWSHESSPFLTTLWNEGVVKFPGYNHAAVAALIRGTHQ